VHSVLVQQAAMEPDTLGVLALHEAARIFYFFRPLSMSILIACDLVTFLPAAHSSTASLSSSGNRIAITGSRPVAGRPRLFFGITFIDFIRFLVLHKYNAESNVPLCHQENDDDRR
jgi:hypothetical protein